MGRIADALRRAEEERSHAARRGSVREAEVAPTPDRFEWSPSFDYKALSVVEPTVEGVRLVEGLPESLVPFYDSSSLISEQYRSLRTRLLSGNPHYEHRVVAITSGAPREGKSVTTLNLAATLAEVRHLKVLAVDGDFRRSSLAGMLNQPEGPGLADVLAGDASYEEVIRATTIPNLYFMPAGSTKTRSAAELLACATAKPTVARMQNDFHYTLIDTPPATTVTDVGIIGQMCSGVIVIVRMNRSHEAVTKQAVKLLQVNNIPILGCLIVGRETATGRYGYANVYQRYYDQYYRKTRT